MSLTVAPTSFTEEPTVAPRAPTEAPTDAPIAPTEAPTDAPIAPTEAPTDAPMAPTLAPTVFMMLLGKKLVLSVRGESVRGGPPLPLDWGPPEPPLSSDGVLLNSPEPKSAKLMGELRSE